MTRRYTQHIHSLTRIWKHPRVSREEILEFRDRKLRSVVANAARGVPHYRALFERAGLSADAIRTAQDLEQVPVSSSSDLRTRPVADTLACDADPASLVCRPTSGTSGRPFVIRRTRTEEHLLNCFRLRAHAQYGVGRRDVLATLGFIGGAHDRSNLPGRIRQRLGILRTHRVDALGTAEEMLAEIARLRPTVLNGFAGALAHAAQHAASFPGLARPRLVVAGGETLTPGRRRSIEEGFGCPVFGIYGAHEFNLIGWQCPESAKFHVCDDNVVLEVLRDGRPAKPGELGEVVVTGLHGYAMPFIRYRLGDVARQGYETCPCGQPFSTLLEIRGRIHDYFRLPGGELMHPDRIIVPIMERESAWFEQYQLLQEREDSVVLRIHPSETPSAAQIRQVEALGRQPLPDGVSFSVELVDELAQDPSGKRQYCKSVVNPTVDDFDWSDVAAD